MTMSTESPAAADRAAELERQIAKLNADLADIMAQEPTSERDLAKVQSSRDWAEHQRAKLIGQRIHLERDIALAACAEIQADTNRVTGQMLPLIREQKQAEERVRTLEAQIENLRWSNRENSRRLSDAQQEVRILENPRFERERQQRFDALKARLLELT